MFASTRINVDVPFMLSSSRVDQEKSRVDEILLRQLDDPKLLVNLVKHRDGYAAFSAASDFESQLDEILVGQFPSKSDPKMIKDIRLISPTLKTLSIHKMLHNSPLIENIEVSKEWSGYNLGFAQRLSYLKMAKYFGYLWNDELMSVSRSGFKVCKLKLEKYIKGILESLNCSPGHDESSTAEIVQFIQEKYIDDLDHVVSTGVNCLISKYNLVQSFERFMEWVMVIGAVPFLRLDSKKTESPQTLGEIHSCFSMESLNELSHITNNIPPLSEVAVILVKDDIECWHLPTKEKLSLFGSCEVRIESSEICLGTHGENLLFAELKVLNLESQHYKNQNRRPHALVETKSTDEASKKPLDASLSKMQKSIFDENNPFSNYSRITEKNRNIKAYVDRVTSEMDELQDRMNSFLDGISPSNANTIVDEMVQQGMESYLRNIKPKMDEWERVIRDHLNKFRIQAVKHLTALPRGLYEFQERAAALNCNNTMDVEEFIEELSSSTVAKQLNVPNVSRLQELDRSEQDLKQMQEKVGQYFELATKFMGYLRDAQKVISKLRVEDSLKELQVKTLTDQKREIVRLAKKFRQASNSRVETYKQQLKAVKHQLDSYVQSQTRTFDQTKRHFLNMRDTLTAHSGKWSKSFCGSKDPGEEKSRILEETFLKKIHSMTNQFETPREDLDVEMIKVEGTVRCSNLDPKIDDNTLRFYRDILKARWHAVLSTIISIREEVTKTGVQIYNVDEESVLTKYVLKFFNLVYDRNFFVKCRSLQECCRVYGINLAIEMTTKKLMKSNTEVRVVKRDGIGNEQSEIMGLVVEK